MGNKDLQAKYDEMHKKGSSSWFSDGREERELILKMGEPWSRPVEYWGEPAQGKSEQNLINALNMQVLEIGCGEGDLCNEIKYRNCSVLGIDYSSEAIKKAKQKYPALDFACKKYRELKPIAFDRLVMQGVLEHLDDPFTELEWMIEHFNPKTVITSSPCFVNPRGIVWMTLDMLGAVMSKTDRHFLHPWDFEEFCKQRDYKLTYQDCDKSWGNGADMIMDLKKRIPLALRDGGLPEKSPYRLLRFLDYSHFEGLGATMVYRIDIK